MSHVFAREDASVLEQDRDFDNAHGDIVYDDGAVEGLDAWELISNGTPLTCIGAVVPSSTGYSTPWVEARCAVPTRIWFLQGREACKQTSSKKGCIVDIPRPIATAAPIASA